MLTVKKQQLFKDNQPFFYLADTCWSAFTNISLADWKYYLKKRKEQGFTVIQINLLPQWDASTVHSKILEPFKVLKNTEEYKEYDYSCKNRDYFCKVEKMLTIMQEFDLVPALVLLWSNYVPNTWVHQFSKNNIMPLELVENFTKECVTNLKKFNPIYFVSGDTDFPDDHLAEKYYRTALSVIKATDPSALVSMHIAGEHLDIPRELLADLDFFSYQSGHGKDGQNTSYEIPQKLRKQGYVGPIINSEVCYEFMPKFSATMSERYNAADVRRASWQAIMAGAFAGITYGAHGIWSWHNNGETFPPGYPYPADWHEALNFQGALDIAYIKEILSKFDINEVSTITLDESKPINALKFGKDYLIYFPSQQNLDISGLCKPNSQIKAIDLTTRYVYSPIFIKHKLDLPTFKEDYLLIINN